MKRTAARVETGAVLTFPTALATESGTISLNISRRVGASSTLMPNAQFLSRFKGDAYHEMAEITDVVDVPATTLSAVAEDIGINHIDFLKLDTQGNEYDILAAAGSFLRRVSVIKVEVEFVELYAGQKLFADVDMLLRSYGFELFDLVSEPACRRPHVRPDLGPEVCRLIWGDGIYVRAPYDFDDPRAVVKSIILAELGLVDPALYILMENPHLNLASRDSLAAIVSARSEPRTIRRRLRRAIERALKIRVSVNAYDWSQGQAAAPAVRRDNPVYRGAKSVE
jgi:FkbM family methyltransferase